jgi:hypothetical protein
MTSVRAERPGLVHVPRAADSGHVGSKRLGDLHCERADSSYSAKLPWRAPNTSSPARKRVTFLPTASTWPAMSTPMALLFGQSISDSSPGAVTFLSAD